MVKNPPIIRDNTPEEEAAIQKAIAADPDTWEATTGAKPRRRGRPAGRTKKKVTVSLDIDLIDRLKSDGEKGWITRLNDAAWSGLKQPING